MSQAVQTMGGREEFLRFVKERAGLEMRSGLEDRVWACTRSAMARFNVKALPDLIDVLTSDQAAFDEFVDELTVGETYFLRTEEHFDWIRNHILPDFRTRFRADRIFRAWSAGCSTGEEAYSLAMLLEEEGLASRSRVIATDISQSALATAQRGRYRAWSLRNTPSEVRDRYFRTVNDRGPGGQRRWFELSPRIKEHVEFRYHNLAVDPYPALDSGLWGLDLILCRNVLIYFGREDSIRVAERMSRCLAPGGWLVPGPSEPSMTTIDGLQVVSAPGVFVYRTERGIDSIGPDAATPNPKPETRAGRVDAPATVKPRKPQPDAVATRRAPQSTTGVGLDPSDPVGAARRALSLGDYARAIAITRGRPQDEDANIIRLRALANCDPIEAERLSGELAEQAPLSEGIQYLRAVLLLSLGRWGQAREAARRLLYLNPSLVVGHLLQASILRRARHTDETLRSYRNALTLCASVAADTPIPFGDGESAGRLVEVISREIEILNDTGEAEA